MTMYWLSTNRLNALERVDPQAGQVVKLRYFLGLSFAGTGPLLGISERSAYLDWSFFDPASLAVFSGSPRNFPNILPQKFFPAYPGSRWRWTSHGQIEDFPGGICHE